MCVVAVVYGLVTIALSFVAEHMTDKLVESTTLIWSVVGGPLAGVFLMGLFFPWVKSLVSGSLCAIT